MHTYRFPNLLSVFFLVFSVLACSVPLGTSPAANPTSTLIDINSLMQPTAGTSSPSSNPAPSGGGSTTSSGGACDNSLYPVVMGATWSYALSGVSVGNFTRTITAVAPDGFTDQDVFANGITRTGQWKCEAGALIGLDPSSSGPVANVQTDTLSANFQTTSMDGVTFPANIQTGITWSQNFTIEGNQSINGQQVTSKNQTSYNCTAGATESISVAAGSFNAVRTDCQAVIQITVSMNGANIPTTINSTSTAWYAPGVGMVKTNSTLADGSTSTLELTSYSIP